jgi:hypothetical protein
VATPTRPVRLGKGPDLLKGPPSVPTLEEKANPITVNVAVDTGDEPPVEVPTVSKPNNPRIDTDPVKEQSSPSRRSGSRHNPQEKRDKPDDKPNAEDPNRAPTPACAHLITVRETSIDRNRDVVICHPNPRATLSKQHRGRSPTGRGTGFRFQPVGVRLPSAPRLLTSANSSTHNHLS